MKRILLVILVLSVVSTCYAQDQEEITLTTYYPAPYGEYKYIGVYNNDILSAITMKASVGEATGTIYLATPLGFNDQPQMGMATNAWYDEAEPRTWQREVDGYYMVQTKLLSAASAAGSGFQIHRSTNTTGDAGATDWTQLLFVRGDGNVGIGTASPEQSLHIMGKVKIVDGQQADGKVLTSDANGVGTWQASPGTEPIYDSGWVADDNHNDPAYIGSGHSTEFLFGTTLSDFPRRTAIWFAETNPPMKVFTVLAGHGEFGQYYRNPYGIEVHKDKIIFHIWQGSPIFSWWDGTWHNYPSGYWRVLVWE